MRICSLSRWLFLFSLASSSTLPTWAQQAQSVVPVRQTKGKFQPAERKVWTNEEISRARRPWDNYLDQKLAAEERAAEAKRVAELAAAEAAKKSSAAPCVAALQQKDDLPKTVEEAQQRIAEKSVEIDRQEDLIRRTREEYLYAPDDQRGALSTKLDRLTNDLEAARAELKLLQAHAEELKSNPAKTQTSVPSATEPLRPATAGPAAK